MTISAAASRLEDAYAFCDAVARKDKPHLYTAAQQFEHQATRDAFAAAYASMRFIDDFVDEIPDRANLNHDARDKAAAIVQRWLGQVERTRNGDTGDKPVWLALSDTFAKFNLPLGPWQDLARAMTTDLHVSMFEDWDHLRRYMRGASVAPAVLFMYLVLVKPDANQDTFICPWKYERVVEVTEDLAIFCYWTHILRDVAIDLEAGGSGLIYFPRADLARFELSPNDLHEMKAAQKADDRYLKLASHEAERAHHHLALGRAHIPAIVAEALPSHAEALTSLVGRYETILSDLEQRNFDVFAAPSQVSE